MVVRVQTDRFDPGSELTGFTEDLTSSGAVVSFSGLVRDVSDGLEVMEIECYPGMTDRAITAIVDQAKSRWSLEDVLVIHRHGPLHAREVIMMVATASRHRVDAFEAAVFLMDYLKSRAPFWKKEITGAGANWVEATQEDEDALTRWTSS